MAKADWNKALQNRIRKLAPEAIETMSELMRDPNTPAPTKAQLIGFVLERTLGKPDAAIHLTMGSGTLRDSENRLIALAKEIHGEPAVLPESGADAEEEPDEEEGELYDEEDDIEE